MLSDLRTICLHMTFFDDDGFGVLCRRVLEVFMVAENVKYLKKSKVEFKQPDFPMDAFDRFKQSKLLELTSRIYEHETRYGVSRLIGLVDSGFREKFWIQAERVYDAQNSRDQERLEKAIKGMVRAYELLEQWAIDNNVPEMPAFKVLEHVKDNGLLMVVCETQNDKIDYLRFNPDKQLVIYTLAEIEKILTAYAIVNEINGIKEQYPDAELVTVSETPNIFDGMDNDLEPLKSASTFVPKFRVPRERQ